MFNHVLPQDWDKLHHAYVISGLGAHIIWSELQNLGFKRQGNPDARSEEFETLGIDESRSVAQWAIMKPLTNKRKVLVAVVAHSFTSEAQNALLKLFEEPPEGTYFFLILPNTSSILPTLLSRVQVIKGDEQIDLNKKYASFLDDDVAHRFKIISPIIKAKDKEKAKALIKFLESRVATHEDVLKFSQVTKIIETERYLAGRSPSIKMLLEYLAVSL